jgi:hypothetical protein
MSAYLSAQTEQLSQEIMDNRKTGEERNRTQAELRIASKPFPFTGKPSC